MAPKTLKPFKLTSMAWVIITLFLLASLIGAVIWLEVNKSDQKTFKSPFEYELGLAEQGLVRSQLYVAKAYDEGTYAPQNLEKAVYWYKRAAENRSSQAMYHYGDMLRTGRGVPKNAQEGFIFIQRAAFVEYAPAEWRIGLMFCGGEGVEADCTKGVEYLQKSAAQSYAPALREMGGRYERGNDVTADQKAACVSFLLAAEAQAPDKKSEEWQKDADALRTCGSLSAADQEAARAEFMQKKPDRSSYRFRIDR